MKDTLRIVYNEKSSSFQDLLNKSNCHNAPQRNNFMNRKMENSVRYGTKSVSNLAPKTWEI